MAGEADEIRNVGVRSAEEEWRRALEFVPHMVQSRGKAASGANLMVAGSINQVMDDMYGTLNLLNGNPSSAEAMRLQNETMMITEAAITSPQVGWGVGNALAAEKRFMDLSRRDAELDAVESRIAGRPEVQRAEASKRVEIGQPDVLTQNRVDKELLTKQPNTVTQPDAQKPEEPGEKERNPRGNRRHGLAGKLLGLDS